MQLDPRRRMLTCRNRDGKYEPTPAFPKALEKAVEFFKDKTR